MKLVLSSKAMRMADDSAITSIPISSIDLMESAGSQIKNHLAVAVGQLAQKRVSIFCGSGNNGGDGFVLARLLLQEHALVQVFTIGLAPSFSKDAATNLERLRQLRSRYPKALNIDRLKDPHNLRADRAPDIIVDALLGTGIKSNVRPEMAEAIDSINRSDAYVVAVDLPSGIDSDTGNVLGIAVEADLTITLAALKPGLLLENGPLYAGTVQVADIGIPESILIECANDTGPIFLIEDEDVRQRLPSRAWNAHKYSVGMLGIVGGSKGLSGAPCMAAMAAQKSGAGLVVCAVPESIENTVASKLLETMTWGLPEDEHGLTSNTHTQLNDRLAKATSLLIGPGLGRLSGTQQFVLDMLNEWDRDVIIDADAIVALVPHLDSISRTEGSQWILTPHAGEFRLFGDTLTDRVKQARKFATTKNLFLVLKGSPTIFATPSGVVFISGAGNKALATAGTGDVLAGMIGAFSSQGLSPEDAVICALHIGGRACDRYCSTRSMLSMTASDLILELPYALFEANTI